MSAPASLLAYSVGAEALRNVGIYLVCLILSVAVHEYCHALAAHRLGDGTPEGQGRLTLNPMAHVHVIGTLALPVMAGLFGWPLFGWGRPVETAPRNYTRKVSMRAGMAIVAVAGPLGNLALLMVVVLVGVLIALAGQLSSEINSLLYTLASLNLMLMVFNLLPVHPLDGGKIVAFLLPSKLQYLDDYSQRYGIYVLMGVLFLGGTVLHRVFAPFMDLMQWVWVHAVMGLV